MLTVAEALVLTAFTVAAFAVGYRLGFRDGYRRVVLTRRLWGG